MKHKHRWTKWIVGWPIKARGCKAKGCPAMQVAGMPIKAPIIYAK
jgi:hypothetical protein